MISASWDISSLSPSVTTNQCNIYKLPPEKNYTDLSFVSPIVTTEWPFPVYDLAVAQ